MCPLQPVYGTLGMSLDENRVSHELAACRQEKPWSCLRLPSELSISCFPVISLPHPSEHARPGWPFVDSDLGESYESLANVQSPSWNHADFCGIRTNGYRVLAAVALSRTIPLTMPKVTDYSIRSKPVAELTSGQPSGPASGVGCCSTADRSHAEPHAPTAGLSVCPS